MYKFVICPEEDLFTSSSNTILFLALMICIFADFILGFCKNHLSSEGFKELTFFTLEYGIL